MTSLSVNKWYVHVLFRTLNLIMTEVRLRRHSDFFTVNFYRKFFKKPLLIINAKTIKYGILIYGYFGPAKNRANCQLKRICTCFGWPDQPPSGTACLKFAPWVIFLERGETLSVNLEHTLTRNIAT